MTSKIDSFTFDLILSINSPLRAREFLPDIESKLNKPKMLVGILNHRFFNLDEKNFIKGTLEAHNLDHLIFSMRPSSQRMVSDCEPEFVEKFKDLSQLCFILQMMARYEIKKAIVEPNHLELPHRDTVTVGEIEPKILAFLKELKANLPQSKNIKKQFPWLYSLEALLPSIRDAQLIFFNHFKRKSLVDLETQYDDNQINNLEKDLYWLGFDASFKNPPHDKPFPETKWTRMATAAPEGKPLFNGKLRYCTRCCLPETMEGISFDEVGICVPCRSSEEKMHIDWEQRKDALQKIIDSHKREDYYDCMLPMSGGKDSTYQAHILSKIYKVTVLATTHGHNWMSLAGRYNLENSLQKFDQDHIMFFSNRSLINKMARKSLEAIGDACWHCHIGAGTFPIQTAIAWDAGLMIWGESIAEADGRGSYTTQPPMASPFYNLEVSARVKAEDMVDDKTSRKELNAWFYPPKDRIKASDLKYIHLGNYFFWDEERQVEFIKRNYEWMESPVENTFKGFKSVECVMAGVHDYSNFLKRGIGRATIQAATDVKRGLITREEGFELAKKHDTQRPHALDYYLRITDRTEEEYEKILTGDARKKSEFAKKMDKV